MTPYRPTPLDVPPDVLVGVLLLLTEDQSAPERWLARAHLSEPTPGDPSRQDLYLLAPDEVQALDLLGLADEPGGPVIRPVREQLLVALRERDAHPDAGDGVPLHVADPSVRPPPLQLAELVAGREADVAGEAGWMTADEGRSIAARLTEEADTARIDARAEVRGERLVFIGGQQGEHQMDLMATSPIRARAVFVRYLERCPAVRLTLWERVFGRRRGP